jgi:predicted hexulose-6-phosphate isomerase
LIEVAVSLAPTTLWNTIPLGMYEKALPSDWSWDRRLAAARAAGFTYLELSIDESQERLDRLSWNPAQCAELRRAGEAAGLPILTLCLSAHRQYPLGSHDPAIRARARDMVARSLCLSGELGARVILLEGYDAFYEPSDEATAGWFVEGLQAAAALAGQAGVMLGLENADRPIVESIPRALGVIQQVNSPWLQLYPDMGNLIGAGYDPVEELALAAGHIVAMHVKDARPGVIRGMPFGEGAVPFVDVFRALRTAGFAGPLTIEMWAHMDRDGDALGSVRAAIRFVRARLAEAWGVES